MHWLTLTLLQLHCAWSWRLWRPILYDLKMGGFPMRPWYVVCVNIPNSVASQPVFVEIYSKALNNHHAGRFHRARQ